MSRRSHVSREKNFSATQNPSRALALALEKEDIYSSQDSLRNMPVRSLGNIAECYRRDSGQILEISLRFEEDLPDLGMWKILGGLSRSEGFLGKSRNLAGEIYR